MHRSILGPLVALVVLVGVASGCRTAQAPLDVEPETSVPPGIESFPLEVVVATRLNVRAGPGAEHPVVGKLAHGEQVRVLEEASGWKRIRPDAGGLEGWVAGEYLQSASTP
jgi:uncharacterized protein YgiM (DUF1202 family)